MGKSIVSQGFFCAFFCLPKKIPPSRRPDGRKKGGISLSFFHGILDDDFCAGFLANGAAVEAQVIVFQVPPLPLGQVVVIGLPGSVGVAHPAGSLLGGVPIGIHGVLELVLPVGIQENVDRVGHVPEDIVRSPAHNDAGPLLRDAANGLGLGQNGPVVGGDAPAGENPGQQTSAGVVLLRAFDHLLRQARFLRGNLDDLLVIIRNLQHRRDPLGHRVTAGAVFPADGDDMLAGIHSTSLSRCLVPVADRLADPLFGLYQLFLHRVADHVGALCCHPVQFDKAHHVAQQGLEIVKATVAIHNGAASGGHIEHPVPLAQAVGPAILTIGESDAAGGDVFDIAAQQGGELILPIGRPHQNHIRPGKLAGIAEHGVVKLPSHLQLVALGQSITV